MGVAVGCGLALMASRSIQPFLFQQSATDPRVYAVGLTTLIVAVAASATPVRRAAGADPHAVLRAE